MHKFFEKYISTLEPKDALKMILKKVHKAKELCSEYDDNYLKELASAHDMIEDYFQVKGMDVKTHNRY